MNILTEVPLWIWLVLVTLLFAEVFLIIKYRRLMKYIGHGPIISPPLFKGGDNSDLIGRSGDLLSYELKKIAKVFNNMRESFGFVDVPIEVGNELSVMMALSSASLNLNPIEHPKSFKLLDKPPEFITNKIEIEYKFIKAPLNSVVSLIHWILKKLPSPYKRKALENLINVTYIRSGENFHITVHKGLENSLKTKNDEKARNAFTGKVAISEGESMLFKVAAFMILELHGEAFKGLKWRGMMHFTTGLEYLIEFLRRPKPGLLEKAKIEFRDSIKADTCEYEACCFLGALLVAERKLESIKEAINKFEHALKTDRPRFKALVHAGLANCYAQQYHRLAKRNEAVLAQAKEQAELASTLWEKETSEKQPWIQYTKALTIAIDEGISCNSNKEEIKKQFIPAMNLCLEAIGSGEGNKLFYNTLGWMFLKMAEKGIEELKIEDGIAPALAGVVPKMAEEYFKKSIQYYKANKLSHANLCLLYATPYYLRQGLKDENIKMKYLTKCRANGIKAVKIDRDYINGYRDLTVSLIRYGQFHEAYEYYLKALEKATYEEKDLEIMADVRKVLMDEEASKDILHKFNNPPVGLLIPE